MRLILLLLLLSYSNSQENCNDYPLNPLACIQETTNLCCQFSYFENKCIETKQNTLGCVENLNKLACLNQLSYKNIEQQCIFSNRCKAVNRFHLNNLGCSELFSKYACTNVKNSDCIWKDKCQPNTLLNFFGENCESVYGASVTPSLCSKIVDQPCMNGGYQNDYQCITIREEQFQSLQCTDLGINEFGCISIITNGQACIFKNNQCLNVLPNEPDICELKLNRLGCLKINNPNLNCQWIKGQCITFIDNNNQCQSIIDVNKNVCINQSNQCLYDFNNNRCLNISQQEITKLKCDTPGLTQSICLQIKDYNCTFYNGICQEMTFDDLNFYQCTMLLNESACVNLKTFYQYCQWDGNQCTKIFINQDIDCPLITENQNIKFNGNVCQAISKPNIKCKYDQQTHKCIQSEITDNCDVPYLNVFGCISITTKGQTCKWLDNGCFNIVIKRRQTTCDSLGFANPIACSQVYENKEKGCYYNAKQQQCQTLLIDISNDASSQEVEQHYQDLLFLQNIGCSSSQLGLNNIACASITTEGQICRWYQNECQWIKNKQDLAEIPCLNLKYSNKFACAAVIYKQEPCRFQNNVKSCINSTIKNMPCSYPGLNAYACAKSTGSCYFDNYCKSLQPDFSTENQGEIKLKLDQLKCVENSPGLNLCKQITTPGQFCQWSFRLNRCELIDVVREKKCLEFSGSNLRVNANVCSAIKMSFPDLNKRGYCAYDSNAGICKIWSKRCSTKCCTENEAIGINESVCSAYSNQDLGTFCYFDYDNKCKELSINEVDITNENNVKGFYNSKKFTCTQMNKNSCHMLEWSPTQRCYHNGISSCLNVNFSYYLNLEIFLSPPSILNNYACLAIEASLTPQNQVKYFGYDEIKKVCKLLNFESETPFNTCEEAIGNRNVCLRYTGNNYCKWDQINLQCITINEDEFQQITTCNYNQNIKACIENQYAACQFQFSNDLCIQAPINVSCSYFDKSGPVSQKVCASIQKQAEICKFQNFKCVVPEQQPEDCDVLGANSVACLTKTTGYCRWDPKTLQCYENKANLSELGCLDNLNKKLCRLVTKEPCIWDQINGSCIAFINIIIPKKQMFLPSVLLLFFNSQKELQFINCTSLYKSHFIAIFPIIIFFIFNSKKKINQNILKMILKKESCSFICKSKDQSNFKRLLYLYIQASVSFQEANQGIDIVESLHTFNTLKVSFCFQRIIKYFPIMRPRSQRESNTYLTD